MPFGSILDPIYASPSSDEIVGYTRCGDSALWTGAYLAAEAFHYKVTQSPDALNNVRAALSALKALADVTGDNRLARCMVPAASPYAASIANQESRNAIHQNPPWVWVGNTSRDAVVGVFFGLGAAYDLVDDPAVKTTIGDVATRLTRFIADHQWSPNDDLSNTFLLRPEELQMLVQVTRHVNPSSNISGPFLVPPVESAVFIDVQDNSSYFKFNLDYMSFYNLRRLQNNDDNRGAYRTVRNYTASHQNAFFDIIDRALDGPNAARDAETRILLEQWLQRRSRDFPVNVAGTVPVCGVEACRPVPVPARPPTDFLWQRNPFQLAGGGDGFVESAGIDYILPYWMARYYNVLSSTTVQSAAAPSSSLAANSLASIYGSDLAIGIAQTASTTLPLTLGGVTLTITDANDVPRDAPLIYVSPTQINFVIPGGAVSGAATFQIANASTTQIPATGTIRAVAPALFAMNGAGSGVAAATAIAVQAANPQLQSPVPVFQCSNSVCTSVPIYLNADSPTYLTLYGTGIRNRSSIVNVAVTINGINVPVLYAGPTPGFAGLDQVNLALPLTLHGSGESKIALTADSQTSNVVTINVQ